MSRASSKKRASSRQKTTGNTRILSAKEMKAQLRDMGVSVANLPAEEIREIYEVTLKYKKNGKCKSDGSGRSENSRNYNKFNDSCTSGTSRRSGTSGNARGSNTADSFSNSNNSRRSRNSYRRINKQVNKPTTVCRDNNNNIDRLEEWKSGKYNSTPDSKKIQYTANGGWVKRYDPREEYEPHWNGEYLGRDEDGVDHYYYRSTTNFGRGPYNPHPGMLPNPEPDGLSIVEGISQGISFVTSILEGLVGGR